MDTGRVSTRYARAAYEYAAERGEDERLYREMKMLAEQFAVFPALTLVMKDPTLKSEEKLKLLVTAAGIEVSESFRQVASLVINHRREQYAHTIALLYQEHYRKSKGLTIAKLTLAEEAHAGLKEKIHALLSEKTEKKVDIDIRVDDTIIGGFILQVESSRLDASVKSSLKRLKRQLAELNKDTIA